MVTKIKSMWSYYGYLWVKSDKDRFYMLMENYNMDMEYDDPTEEWDEITEALYNELIKLNK
jgi:hypothetical protein